MFHFVKFSSTNYQFTVLPFTNPPIYQLPIYQSTNLPIYQSPIYQSPTSNTAPLLALVAILAYRASQPVR
jgi:hypothetical protein